MVHHNTASIVEGMFAGEKLYQQRARQALPLLVRHALAQSHVYYGQLSQELGMPNARNLNYVLGCIGTTLKHLADDWGEEIPLIQSLVIGRSTGLPGSGFFEGFTNLKSPTQQQRKAILNQFHARIFAYPKWLEVLTALGLHRAESNVTGAVEKARHGQGGGEGEAHRKLKDRIYNNPALVEAPSKPTVREREFPLPSGDRLDVYFEFGRRQFVVEVKPSESTVDDIARGLFQCVKYEVILIKWRAWQSEQVDIRVTLALGGLFPESLRGLRNVLQVEVIDQLDRR